MYYALDFSKQALKELEKINEPFYSNIKQAIFNLTEDPRPNGCKKLKGREKVTELELATIVLSMIFLTKSFSLMS